MRLRIMYSLSPELKFLGNLDTLRMLARCLRRARVPFALSEGFNPHIKMSLGTVLPVGIWSEGEWLDLDLTESMPADEVILRMNSAAPGGLHFIKAEYIEANIPTLMSIVDSACYCFEIAGLEAAPEVIESIEGLDSKDHLKVQSRGKQKDKVKDLAPGVYRIKYQQIEPNRAVIYAWVASGSVFNVRPDELMEILNPLLNPGRIIDCYRKGNYIKIEGEFKLPVKETFTSKEQAGA
ncbi:MAG: TIGR03936 family radical SAM-associated protein [Methylocystaceae bacterium]